MGDPLLAEGFCVCQWAPLTRRERPRGFWWAPGARRWMTRGSSNQGRQDPWLASRFTACLACPSAVRPGSLQLQLAWSTMRSMRMRTGRPNRRPDRQRAACLQCQKRSIRDHSLPSSPPSGLWGPPASPGPSPPAGVSPLTLASKVKVKVKATARTCPLRRRWSCAPRAAALQRSYCFPAVLFASGAQHCLALFGALDAVRGVRRIIRPRLRRRRGPLP